jgi:hypothetical protein
MANPINPINAVFDIVLTLAVFIIAIITIYGMFTPSNNIGANTSNNVFLGIQSYFINYWLGFLVAITGISLLLFLVFVRNKVRKTNLFKN